MSVEFFAKTLGILFLAAIPILPAVLYVSRRQYRRMAKHNLQIVENLLTELYESKLNSETVNIDRFVDIFNEIVENHVDFIATAFQNSFSAETHKNFRAAIRAAFVCLIIYTYEFSPYMINHSRLTDSIIMNYESDPATRIYLKQFDALFPKFCTIRYSLRDAHEAIVREKMIEWFGKGFKTQNYLYAQINNWLRIVHSSGVYFSKKFEHLGLDYIKIK